MNCDEVMNLLDPFADQELPDRERDAVKLHLDGCPACQRELRQINDLRKTLKQVPRHAVPDHLMNGVRERIADAATADNRIITRMPWDRWMKPIVTHAAAALVGGIIFYGAILPSTESTVPAREIVAVHVRSLMDERLTQVKSGETHTVGPWFSGKIDFAPAVADLSAEGYPLLGGRVDYLQERKVAALVYLRRKHRINLFVMPDTGRQSKTMETVQWTHNGYNIVGWRNNHFIYWAVSDLNKEELTAFSKLTVAR